MISRSRKLVYQNRQKNQSHTINNYFNSYVLGTFNY